MTNLIKISLLVLIATSNITSSLNTLLSLKFKENEGQEQKYNYTDMNTIQCLKEICVKYAKILPTVVFNEDIKKYNIAKTFLNEYIGLRIIQSKINYKALPGLYIIFLNVDGRDDNDVEHLKLILNPELYKTRAMFILVTREKQNLFGALTMIKYMEQFWRLRLMNLIVMTTDSDKIYLYTYSPYSENHCSEVGRPVLVDMWYKSNKTFQMNKQLFTIEEKVKNLHGCVLYGVGKTRPPESIIVKKNNNTWELHGMGGFMLKTLEKYMNFSTVISIPANKSIMDEFGYSIANGIPEEITENLITGEKDFGFGIFSHIIYFLPGTEFSKISFSECFIWYAPCKAGHKPSKWNNYIKEFSLTNWLLIVVVFILTVIINKLTYAYIKKYRPTEKKYKHHLTVFIIFAICLGQSISKNINNLIISKSYTVIWIFYCLIIYSLYQASMGSFMTVPWQTKNIETLEEILDFNLKVVGYPQSYNILSKSVGNNRIMQKIIKKYKKIDYGTYNQIIKWIVDNRDTVTFAADRFIQHYSVHRNKDVKSKDALCRIGECMIQASASPFLLKKGSPLINPINKITGRMFESGLLNQLWVHDQPNLYKLKREKRESKFSLKQLTGAFILYVTGKALALIVFCLEHIYYYYNK
ncbi:uncharacterized protein LOC142318523 [Lycorma delicatula]|uniref:uncharacterized protein LOC142318523 n=1 Tax=Lycorma delicatula TaxID=130591 RepID=UPI003F50F4B0